MSVTATPISEMTTRVRMYPGKPELQADPNSDLKDETKPTLNNMEEPLLPNQQEQSERCRQGATLTISEEVR